MKRVSRVSTPVAAVNSISVRTRQQIARAGLSPARSSCSSPRRRSPFPHLASRPSHCVSISPVSAAICWLRRSRCAIASPVACTTSLILRVPSRTECARAVFTEPSLISCSVCCVSLASVRLDLRGGVRGFRRQVLDLGRDHREAPAGVAGAGGLDRGVQREQLSLARDQRDFLGHAAHMRERAAQRAD